MSRRAPAWALALLLLLAAPSAWAAGDVLAGPHAPLPGPQWRLYQDRGVSLGIPARWYGFFYVGLRPFYGWWALKRHALYTEMEFSLFEAQGLPQAGRRGQVETRVLGPSRLAGLPARAFGQTELAGTPDARRRLILVLDRPLPNGRRLWAVADSDAKLWQKTRPTLDAVLASLRIEPFFFILGSQWRLVEHGGVYLESPWDWEGRALPDGYQWSGGAGQGRTLAISYHQGPPPDLAGWTLAGQSRLDSYPCQVYDRKSAKDGAAVFQRLALVDEPLADRRRIWLRGELRGAASARDWDELRPALNAMLRSVRIDWELF